MNNFEIRKELYEMLGQTVIYTAEFQSRNLMTYFGETSLIIMQIYSCLSNPLIMSKIKDEVSDDFLIKKIAFIKEQIKEHFENSVSTAEQVCAEVPEKEMTENVRLFVNLISLPREIKKERIETSFD